MQFIDKSIYVFGRYKISVIGICWVLLAVVAGILELSRSSINNYQIFQGVFWHTLHQQPLYLHYPNEYFDKNHYGPFFSIVIAPFALLPNSIGVLVWNIANAGLLLYAVQQLPIEKYKQYLILWIALIEMMTAAHSVQFNSMLAAWLILSYTQVQKGKDVWATLFIAAGFMVKLYGIAGLVFFLFSKRKWRFVVSFTGWLLLFFLLPMLLSSPNFQFNAYTDWAYNIIEKNAENASIAITHMQDISVMGIVKRGLQLPNLSMLPFLIFSFVGFCVPLINIKAYQHIRFQLYYLALVLISVVVYSSSAESATYIIAVIGVAIWCSVQKQLQWWHVTLLILLFICTILSPTELCPPFLKQVIKQYALKALPCFIAWCCIVYALLTEQFIQQPNT